MFFAILKIELFKIFKRPRTFIAFVAVAVIVFMVQLAIKVNGKDLLRFFTDSLGDTFDVPADQILNGYYVCLFALHTILIHVPLLVALIAADMISGEANLGTLRLIAGKPVTRSELVLAKFFASTVYVILLLIWMALIALLGSLLMFGDGGLFVSKESSIHLMDNHDVLWRFFAAFIFAALGLTVIAAMGMMFSAFSDNSLGPIVATVCVVIVFTVLQQLKVPVFEETVNKWSFTTHMLGWKGFFYVEKTADGTTIDGSIENPSALIKSGLVLVGYISLFLFITIRYFKKKDILS
ncbi:MAG: ABC transporter permease subunit [Chitinophagaceae bacterium]|nr:ABC transporter permease subunit [Chitinophagaceae bacterium]